MREVWERWKAYRKGQAPRPNPTDTSWIETVEALAERGYDLSAKNPSRSEDDSLPPLAELTAMLLEHSREFHSIVERLHEMVANGEEAQWH